MFDLSAYALRFLEYLVLMVLFGVPLFGWYGSRRSTLADALAGWPLMGVLLVSAAVGTVLTGADIVFKTAGIMGMPVADVDRASLGWYLLETSAGRAAMARGALLVALMFVLGFAVALKPFLGPKVETPKHAHDGPVLLLAGPVVLALGSLFFALFSGWSSHLPLISSRASDT